MNFSMHGPEKTAKQISRPVNYRSSHLNKSDDYHSSFVDSAQRAMVWELEQRTIAQLINRYFPVARPVHLDFACGTGRILTFLEPYCASSTGVDVSESMLSVARRNSPHAEIVHCDITRSDAFAGRTFDLITAFRFFPNAEESLRIEAMRALALMLSEGGILIFNNHLNDGSLLRSAVKATGRDPGHGMTRREVADILKPNSLELVGNVGIGVLPLLDRHVVTPRTISAAEWALTRLGVLRRFAQDQLYIAIIRP